MSAAPIAPGSRPRRHPDSAYRVVADEGGLVVLPGRAEVKVLNPVGARVFGLLDGEHSLEQITRVVCDEYQVDEARASADVRDFVRDLAEHGMLAEPAAAGEGA